MNWTRPLEEFVEVMVAVWLFQIIFKPRKSNETIANTLCHY
jgi:hypothetical protein